MIRYAVYSTNNYGDYDFLAPLAALVWRARTEFTPVCLLTQTREHWDETRTGRIVIDYLNQWNVEKHYIGNITEPYRTSVQAQAGRQHFPAHKKLDPHDYVMTSDVDMLPIRGSWFSSVDWSKPCHVRHASAWGYRWHTTPYFGASVYAWREFMGYEPTGNIGAELQKSLDADVGRDRDTLAEWFSDEFIWNSRIRTSRFWKDGCQFIERNVAQDRMDRGAWPESIGSIEGYIDAHVLRPSWTDANWPRTRPLIERLLPSLMEDVDRYRDKYVETKR